MSYGLKQFADMPMYLGAIDKDHKPISIDVDQPRVTVINPVTPNPDPALARQGAKYSGGLVGMGTNHTRFQQEWNGETTTL
jgi:hypothetical protein